MVMVRHDESQNEYPNNQNAHDGVTQVYHGMSLLYILTSSVPIAYPFTLPPS